MGPDRGILKAVRKPALLTLLFAVAALLLGCGRAPGGSAVLPLPHWTLQSRLGTSDVTVPAHLEDELPPGRITYTLSTRVELPPDLRDRPLTLAIGHLPAITHLRVAGRDAVAMDPSTLDRYRSQGQHAWRIEREETRAGSVDLELTVERTWGQASWVNTVPTLSATPGGPPLFLFVTQFNQVTSEVSLATALLMSFTYAVLYLLDRRRTTHAWLALQGIFGASYPACILGLSQPLFGTADMVVTCICICAAAVCSLNFASGMAVHRDLQQGWWGWVGVASIIAIAVGRDPFRAPFVCALLVVAALAMAAGRVVRVMLSVKLQPTARMVVVGYLVAAALGLPDTITLLGGPELLEGLRGGPLALGMISLLQALALSRSHAESLRRADDLNAELGNRVVLLERNNEEIRHLNEELRRQIAARSERLADTLARIGPMHTPPRAFAPGDAIDGRYRVVRRIGEGGMGTVYEIERLSDGRRLALKVLQTPRTGAELARLAREAEIASRVDHPNVVGIVDVDIAASGALFVVMEFVDGASLDALRERYADLPWGIAVLRQIAAGLTALHAQGVVHRDLKPGNVLVARRPSGDVAKIADFGIATRSTGDTTTAPRLATAPEETLEPRDVPGASTDARAIDATPKDPPLTLTGQILGTPVYMAPELLRGARLATPASDVYSFGVIAWEILTGALPEGFEVLMHLRSREGVTLPSIRTLLPALSPRVAELLDACLSRDATARPDAAALASALATPHEIRVQAS